MQAFCFNGFMEFGRMDFAEIRIPLTFVLSRPAETVSTETKDAAERAALLYPKYL